MPPDPTRDPATYRALVHAPGARFIEVLDQRALPHVALRVRIADADTAALAIRRMWVRGAPLIGAVGAYGLALGARPRRLGRGARQGARRARRDAADRRQPALGARPRPRGGRAAADRCARRRGVARGRRDRCRGRRDQPRDRLRRARAPARHRPPQAGPRQRDDALQRRRARDLRLGHRDGAAVPRRTPRDCRCTSGSAKRGRGCRARI